jgi:hypothetical protein
VERLLLVFDGQTAPPRAVDSVRLVFDGQPSPPSPAGTLTTPTQPQLKFVLGAGALEWTK